MRFTTQGELLCAIALGWPEDGWLTVRALREVSGLYPRAIGKVELLGSRASLSWQRDAQGLRVQLPPERPCDHAYTLRITAGR